MGLSICDKRALINGRKVHRKYGRKVHKANFKKDDLNKKFDHILIFGPLLYNPLDIQSVPNFVTTKNNTLYF